LRAKAQSTPLAVITPNLLAESLLERRPPRDELESKAVVDHREPA
jgi:hypothetical protein